MRERHVKLFRNGRNQAVRIPREFELPGQDVIMRKEGERLIIEPTPPKSLLAVLATLAPIDEEFSPIDDMRRIASSSDGLPGSARLTAELDAVLGAVDVSPFEIPSSRTTSASSPGSATSDARTGCVRPEHRA